MTRQAASEWGCIVSGIVTLGTAIGWAFHLISSASGFWLPLVSIAAALLCAALFYMGKKLENRPQPIPNASDKLEAFKNPQWETISRRQFTNEQVEIDGKRFYDCAFNNVTLMFHGNAPSEFLGKCVFGGNLRLGTDSDPAMHYSKLCQIFSNIPGLHAEFVSSDERGNPLSPTFEIEEVTPNHNEELSEIYADVILSWLKKNCHSTCTFSTEDMTANVALPVEKVSLGLEKLQTLKLVSKESLFWKFVAVSAINVTPGYARTVGK